MNKKGSMELSVNSIVILVIAIVMMGLILGFVKSKFSGLDKQLITSEADAPTATASDAITLSRSTLVVNAGEQVGLKFQAYALRDIGTDDKPYITCSNGGPGFDISVNGKIASQGETVKYEGIAKVGSSVKGKYLCALGFGSDGAFPEKDLIVEVV